MYWSVIVMSSRMPASVTSPSGNARSARAPLPRPPPPPPKEPPPPPPPPQPQPRFPGLVVACLLEGDLVVVGPRNVGLQDPDDLLSLRLVGGRQGGAGGRPPPGLLGGGSPGSPVPPGAPRGPAAPLRAMSETYCSYTARNLAPSIVTRFVSGGMPARSARVARDMLARESQRPAFR